MKPHLGFCRLSRSDELFQITVAALCSSADEFEPLVSQEIIQDGYWLHWVKDVLPAEQWLIKHPDDWGDNLLICLSHENPVVLGPIEPLYSPPLTQNLIDVQDYPAIEPLDTQFGLDPKKTVPDSLHEILFGQPLPSETEITHYQKEVPVLRTYAVLDATKMPYLLLDLLEGSGLHYASLFQGKAQEDYFRQAPYLVELDENNAFTRQLFTGTKGILGLWEKSLGSFVRSRSDFDPLRHHLRKFTRLRDEQNKWYFFRFWEKTSLPALTKGPPAELAEAILQDSTPSGLVWIVPFPEEARVITIQRNPDSKGQPTQSPMITQAILDAFDQTCIHTQDSLMLKDLLAEHPISQQQEYPIDESQLRNLLKALRDQGFLDSEKRKEALAHFLTAVLQGKEAEATEILNKIDQGPTIRLWHLNKLIKESL